MKVFFIISFFFFPFAKANELIKAVTEINQSLELLQGTASRDISCFSYDPGINVIPETIKERSCPKPYAEIPVGSYRLNQRHELIMKDVNERYISYRSGNYLLSRPEKNKYQAILNLNLIPGRTGSKELASEMLRRTRNCLKEMAPYMKGPSGEEFEILVVTPSEDLPGKMKKPQAITISVTKEDEGYRGDASNFGSNFQCHTIGHEILHHLGLCDEYYEPMKDNFDWSCRQITALPSYMRNIRFSFDAHVPQTSRCECDTKCQIIMKNPNARNIYLSMTALEIIETESSLVNEKPNSVSNLCRFKTWLPHDPSDIPSKAFKLHSREVRSGGNEVFQFYSYAVGVQTNGSVHYDKALYECDCPPAHPYCKRMMEQFIMREKETLLRPRCPASTVSKSMTPAIGADPGGTRVTNCLGEGKEKKCELIVTTPGNGESLLRPAHFQKILAGSCAGGAPSYEACEKYSYIGSKTMMCSQKPPECNSDEYFLLGNRPTASQR